MRLRAKRQPKHLRWPSQSLEEFAAAFPLAYLFQLCRVQPVDFFSSCALSASPAITRATALPGGHKSLRGRREIGRKRFVDMGTNFCRIAVNQGTKWTESAP